MNSAWTGFWNGYAEGLDRTGHQLCEAESYRCKCSDPCRCSVLAVNGETWNLGGYLDIGIVDTMKDLIVNFIGAVVFSIIGILYLRNRGKGKLAASLIPQVRSKQEEELSSKNQ